jgi:hypothetical protein
MRKFAKIVDDNAIGATPWHQLSWSHIRGLLPIKSQAARWFYVTEAVSRLPASYTSTFQPSILPHIKHAILSRFAKHELC